MPNLLTRLGFWLVHRGQRVDKRGRSTVTSGQRERILELDVDGASLRDIASDVGCSAETVRKVLRLAKPKPEVTLKDRLEAIALKRLETDPSFQDEAVDQFMQRTFGGRRDHSHLGEALEELRLLKDLQAEASPSGSALHDLVQSPAVVEAIKVLPGLLALGQPQAPVSVAGPVPASLPPTPPTPTLPTPPTPPAVPDAGMFEPVLTRLLPLVEVPGKEAADRAWAILEEFDKDEANDQADLLFALVHMPLARLQVLAHAYKGHATLGKYVERFLSDQGHEWVAAFVARWQALGKDAESS